MKTIPRIEELAFARDPNLRSEIGSGETLGQARNLLSRLQSSVFRVEVEQDESGSFFLYRVTPSAIRMEGEVARPIACWHGCIVGKIELSGLLVHSPSMNRVGTKISAKDELPRRIGFNHVSVSTIVTADGKASGVARSLLLLGQEIAYLA